MPSADTQSLNLALALFKYFPYGGLQRNFHAIATELARRGHRVRVFTGSWEGERPADFQVSLIATRGLSNPARNRSFHGGLRSALLAEPADLVIGFNKMPDLDVYYCADTCFATRVYEEKPWYERLTSRVRWSLRYESAVFARGLSTRVLLLSAAEGVAYRKYYQIEPERLLLMPPGINRDRVRGENAEVRAARARRDLGLSDADRVLVFLGSDYKRKGLDRTLQAVAALPAAERESVKLLVIGRDKRQARYQQLATKLGIAEQTLFLGQRDDIPDLLFTANALLHPAYLENTGNVIVEALVAGVPVLCSGTCGYAHYVRYSGLGKVVEEPFEQAQLNRALQDLLEDQRDWHDEGARFAASADVFSRPQRAADTIESLAKPTQQPGTEQAA